MIIRLVGAKRFFFLLPACMMVAGLAGCSVNVRGRKRPIVTHERIQGELELAGEHRIDEQGVGDRERKSKTTVFEERLNLRAKGDVYHPNLLFFDTALGLGLAEQYVTSGEGSDNSVALLDTYAVALQFLRMKPYPLTISVSKSDDLIARQFLGSLRTERKDASLSLSLKLEDWPQTFQYSTSDISQDSLGGLTTDFFSRQENRFKYTLDHDFSRFSHLRLEFDRSDISNQNASLSTDSTENRLTASHEVTFGKQQHRFDSFLSYIERSGFFTFERLRAVERLRLQHSHDFSTNYELSFNDTDQDRFANEEIRAQAGFEHSLYESLVTVGDVFASYFNLDEQGELKQGGGTISFSYQKKNPWGTLLSTYSASVVNSRQSGGSGTGVVADEQHTATSLFPVQLDRTNIDISSIRVKDAPGAGLLFQLGDDYTITEAGGRVFLNIITVGGVALPNFTEDQQFFVDYTFFIEPEREEETLRQNFTLRERFKNGISIYYSHRRQDEDISTTLMEITPDEFRINTVGAEYLKGGLSLLAEYSKQDSTQLPSTSTRLEGRYGFPLGATTRISVSAGNHWVEFGEPDPREVTRFEIGAEIRSHLSEGIRASAGMDYRNERDSTFGTTEGFELTSAFEYDFHSLSISTGVEIELLTRRNDDLSTKYVFFRLIRSF